MRRPIWSTIQAFAAPKFGEPEHADLSMKNGVNMFIAAREFLYRPANEWPRPASLSCRYGRQQRIGDSVKASPASAAKMALRELEVA